MPEEKANVEGAEAAGEHMACCPLGAMFEAGAVLRSKVMDFFPTEFVEHAVGARREFLLAVRSLVDEALKAQDSYISDYRERQRGRASRKGGPQKVAVE